MLFLRLVDTPNIDRIQFALAGMNTHVIHDLALALIQTNTQMNLYPSLQSPEHDDYQRVNGILADVLPKALTVLATGILGQAAQDHRENRPTPGDLGCRSCAGCCMGFW